MTSEAEELRRREQEPWYPITDQRLLKYLGKLGEELGEASATVCRCVIQGLPGEDPKTHKTNQAALQDELADVLANIRLVSEELKLDQSYMEERAMRKIIRQRLWHNQLPRNT